MSDTPPRALYSIPARIGGGGIGNIAATAAAGLHAQGYLQKLFVSSNRQTLIPENLIAQWGAIGRALKYAGAQDPTGLVYFLESTLFDAWVAAQLPEADIFHAWNGAGLQSIKRAKRLGMQTIVERASSHPGTTIRLLQEEYARWNIPLRLPQWHQPRLLTELQTADYITIPSSFVRESMLAAGHAPAQLLEIPFGVDLDTFTPPASQPPARPFRAIFAGQISIRKGVPYLLEAWKAARLPQAELWLVGAIAHDFAAIKHRWDDVPGVTYLSYAPRLVELFQHSDVFVFPTIEEGSALVTYEALACGLPLLTTPNAGSVARDQQDGLVVPIRDVEALRAGLAALYQQPAWRRTLSRSARQRAEMFPWTRYQQQLCEAYRRIAHV